MDDNKLFYWREAKQEVRQLITETAIEMVLPAKIEGKGMEAEEVGAYNGRVANYNDGILGLAKILLDKLEVEDDAGEG